MLEAAAGGLALEDLAGLAQQIHEAWQAQHPGPDDGPGDDDPPGGDADGFEDRCLRLGVTLDGVGRVTGDLTAGCAA